MKKMTAGPELPAAGRPRRDEAYGALEEEFGIVEITRHIAMPTRQKRKLREFVAQKFVDLRPVQEEAVEKAEELLSEIYRGLDDTVDMVQTTREEYREYFSKQGDSSGHDESSAKSCLQLFEMLDLGANDVVCDMGSGTGKVVVLARAFTDVKKAFGVELSPKRDAIATEALRRLISLRGESRPVELHRGDFRTCAPVEANVIFITIRMLATVLPAILESIQIVQRSRPNGSLLRVMCCGFTLPSEPGPGITLERTFACDAFLKKRLVLEYHVICTGEGAPVVADAATELA